MAIQPRQYLYCDTGCIRYLGIDDATGDLVGNPSAGPDIGGSPIEDDDYDFDSACEVSGDQVYNDGTWKVTVKTGFPYGNVINIASPPDKPDPPPVVCGLITLVAEVTNESSIGAADGEINITTKDPNSSAAHYYAIGADFVYPSGGLAGTVVATGTYSKLFNGLVAGTYTVYVRNSSTCLKVIELTVGADNLYEPKYRLDLNDIFNTGTPTKFRFDIEQKHFAGSVTEVIGTAQPGNKSWRNESSEDIFDSVVPVEFGVSLVSETDEQFTDLYTTDEREFRGSLYEYVSGSYVLRWQGFQLPMLYSEPYSQLENYDVNLSFIDLGSLANEPFTTSGGTNFTNRISLFTAIYNILLKTGLYLPIWESANLYSADMDAADADSMLTQCYIDPEVYLDDDGEPQDSLTVLKSLMFNWGLRLYQAVGRWNIELVTQKFASSVLTRKFSALGVYDSNESLNPRIALRRGSMPSPKVNFMEQSAQKSIPEQFGKIKVVYNLGLEQENNLLVRGKFEAEDIVNGQFTGWQVTPQASSGATFGLELLPEERNGADSALYIDFTGIAPDKYVDVVSAPIEIVSPTQYTLAQYTLNLKFDVYTRPAFKETHIYLDFCLGLNDNEILINSAAGSDGEAFVSPYNSGAGWVDGIYNRMIIKDHLTWKEVNLNVRVRGVSTNGIDHAGPMSLQLRVRSNPEYDFGTPALLQAVPTYIGTILGKVAREKYQLARVLDTVSGQQVIRTYSLQAGAIPGSAPDYLQPADYESVTNPLNLMHWKLEQTVVRPGTNNWLQSILLTNMQVSYLPDNIPPQQTVSKEILMFPGIKRTYERTLLHGDITPEMDANYRHITKGHLTLADGTLIEGGWYRKGVTEDKLLHELIADMYEGQYTTQRWKLIGDIMPDGVTPSYYNIFQEYRTGRVYMPVSMSYDLRNAVINIEMIEGLKGEAVVDEGDPEVPVIEPPVATGAYNEAYSEAYD